LGPRARLSLPCRDDPGHGARERAPPPAEEPARDRRSGSFRTHRLAPRTIHGHDRHAERRARPAPAARVMTSHTIEVEAFEAVVPGGVRRVTWLVESGDEWLVAGDYPGANVERGE